MKTIGLQEMSVDQLVERFIKIGIKQDETFLTDETAKFNQLYKQKIAVVAELRSRDGDQRRALLRLYDHPNMQVRLNAVTATLALAPEAGRRALEAIRDSRTPNQALAAGMTLFTLDDGVFKPT